MNIFAKKMNTTKPSIPINKSIVSIYLILSKLINSIIGKKTLLTNEMVEFLDGDLNYSNQKIQNKLNYQFIEFSKSLEETTKI